MSLILGTLAGLTGSYILYNDFRKDTIEINRQKRVLNKKFNTFLDSLGNESENKMEQRYKILKYIPMQYGCDIVVSIPFGKDLNDFHKILSKLKVVLQANIIAELSSSGNSIYCRIHYKDKEIAEKWDIRIKWYELMFHGINSKASIFRNKDYDTFRIKSVIEEPYGFNITLDVPIGLNHIAILDNLKEITNAYKCNVWGEYNREKSELCMTIIKKEFPDDFPYEPIKTKVNEFYIGMTYDYKKVIVDLEDYCHIMYSGMTSMGKTVALLMGLTNLIHYHSPKELELYLCQISGKQDLQLFKNVKHCRYYAKTIEDVEKVLNHVLKEMKRRNNMMFEGKEYIENISKWNKRYPNNKFSEIYLAMDESAQYQPTSRDDKETKKRKQRCLSAMTQILQEGRSAGVHMVVSLQRPSKDSFDAPMKAQIGTKIVFKQPNIASSLVVLDSGEATELKKREAIVEFDKRYLMKTLYLTPAMVQKYIKKWEVANIQYLNLDDSGNIAPLNNKMKNVPLPILDDNSGINTNSMPSLTIPSRKVKQFERRKKFLDSKKK